MDAPTTGTPPATRRTSADLEPAGVARGLPPHRAAQCSRARAQCLPPASLLRPPRAAQLRRRRGLVRAPRRPAVSEGLERHLCQGKVVAQLGADRHQDPRIAGLVEIRRRLGWEFPYAERANVVVPRRKSSEIEVKDSVGGM